MGASYDSKVYQDWSFSSSKKQYNSIVENNETFWTVAEIEIPPCGRNDRLDVMSSNARHLRL